MKKMLKTVMPTAAWNFVRSIYLKRRQRLAPKIGQFDDASHTQKVVGKINYEWKRRIKDVISCPDNAAIPRHEKAGVLDNGVLTMHNGIKVGGLSYYGAGVMNLLMQNKGVHEPQEERAFQSVLNWIEPGSTMLELGAYWGFYSLWFADTVPEPKNFLLEPMEDNLAAGVVNFRLNNKQAVFEKAFVGLEDSVGMNSIPTISVDSFMLKHAIDKLAILHSDVQGAELDMLYGAQEAIRARKIDYFFISTHRSELHQDCIEYLEKHEYRILASANLDESYADDGVIVAISPTAQGPDSLEIAIKG